MKLRLVVLVALLAVGLLAGWVAILWYAGAESGTVDPIVPEEVDIEALKTKAGAGEPEAQRALGAVYAKGQGVKEDYAEAARLYRQAADQGNAKAQAALGELYEAGQGVPRDDAEAAKWYRRAAEQGDVFGQYSLAVLYLMGRGVTKDVAEALKWYRKAAEQGNPLAQYNLGMRHAEGDGVPQDFIEAYKWLSLAAKQGIADAAEARDQLQKKLTRDQLKEGRQRVEAFTARSRSQ